VFASDVGDFVDELNTAWVNKDYTTCLSNINNRLAVNTNDLPALIAKTCYHVFVESDFESATNLFARTDLLLENLSATNKTEILKLYEGLRDDVVTCLAVPMTETPPETQKQYIRDALYPTNYPEQKLLRMLDVP